MKPGDRAVWTDARGAKVLHRLVDVLDETIVTFGDVAQRMLRLQEIGGPQKWMVRADAAGLRPIVADPERIWELLAAPASAHEDLAARFATGRLEDIALVFREMNRRYGDRPLDDAEAHILGECANLLVSELALAEGGDASVVVARLEALFPR